MNLLGCVAATKVVCETGTFTIRDAILFHKFCIFNKEYFVFLAHPMFGCKCVTNSVFLFHFIFVSQYSQIKSPSTCDIKR